MKPVMTSIVVTVKDQDLKTIDVVAKALKAAGMQVGNVLSTTGIITGAAAKGQVAALRKVPGVEAVEVDQEMRAI